MLQNLIERYQNSESIEALRETSHALGDFLRNNFVEMTIDETIEQMPDFARIGYVYPESAPSYYLNSNLSDCFLVNCSDGYFFVAF